MSSIREVQVRFWSVVRSRRGASMIEVMMAGTVLLLGLVGILQLILLGIGNMRNADVQQAAQSVVNSTLANLRNRPFASLDAGILVLSPMTDDVGRTYNRTATIVDINDGGQAAYRIDLIVNWNQRVGGVNVGRNARGTAVVMEARDAGP